LIFAKNEKVCALWQYKIYKYGYILIQNS
jgi:hypothetical protein